MTDIFYLEEREVYSVYMEESIRVFIRLLYDKNEETLHM